MMSDLEVEKSAAADRALLTAEERKLPRSQRKKLLYQRNVEIMREQRKEKKQIRKRHANDDAKQTDEPHMSKRQRIELMERRCAEAMKSGYRIAVDLSLEDLMSNKEHSKMCQQLNRLYGINRHSQQPFHLYMTGFDKEKPLYQMCVKKNQGFEKYKVTFNEEHYEQIFNKDDIIYLTPDSDNVLDTLSKEHIYILGGLVDEHILKGKTLSLAEDRGLRTARLPIQEYLGGVTGQIQKTVLSIVQVLEILLHFHETNDWYASLSGVMPKRFGFIVKNAPKPNSSTVKPPEMETEPGKAQEHSENVTISVKLNDSQLNMIEDVHCNDSAVSHAENSHCNDSTVSHAEDSHCKDSAVSHAEDSHCNDSAVSHAEDSHCNDSAVSHADDSHCNDPQTKVDDKGTIEDKDIVIVNQIAATTEGDDITGEDITDGDVAGEDS